MFIYTAILKADIILVIIAIIINNILNFIFIKISKLIIFSNPDLTILANRTIKAIVAIVRVFIAVLYKLT